MPGSVLVRSSLNIDEIVRVPHTVRPGETLASTTSQRLIGGKGANIAVAAAQGLAHGSSSSAESDVKEGTSKVYLAGSIGSDGKWILPELRARGVSTDLIQEQKDTFTGTAFIQVTDEGENSIVLRQGANFVRDAALDAPGKLHARVSERDGSYPTVLLLHNEIQFDVTQAYLSHRASDPASGPITLWNPSPMPTAQQLQETQWKGVDVLVINNGEALDLLAALRGEAPPSELEDSALSMLRATPALGQIPWIVLTRGSRGVIASVRTTQPAHQPYLGNSFQFFSLPASKAEKVVDTTGAGDTFTGFLAAAIAGAGGLGPLERPDKAQHALAFASLAAALAVERPGAMSSIPSYADVLAREQSKK